MPNCSPLLRSNRKLRNEKVFSNTFEKTHLDLKCPILKGHAEGRHQQYLRIIQEIHMLVYGKGLGKQYNFSLIICNLVVLLRPLHEAQGALPRLLGNHARPQTVAQQGCSVPESSMVSRRLAPGGCSCGSWLRKWTVSSSRIRVRSCMLKLRSFSDKTPWP